LDALASAVIGVPDKAQTAAIPGSIARICNAAWRVERGAGKRVAYSPKRYTWSKPRTPIFTWLPWRCCERSTAAF